MAIVVQEKYAGLSLSTGRDSGAEIIHVVSGSSDQSAVADAVLASARTMIIVAGRILIQEKIGNLEEIHDGWWMATVHYAVPQVAQQNDPEGVEEPEFSFKTTGGTQHVTQALNHVADYAAGGGVGPSHRGAIGVTDDGVDGCDIHVPVYEFNEVRVLTDEQMTDAYKAQVFNLTATKNNATFKGFQPGECLFLGLEGSRRRDGSGKWDCTYNFAAIPNKTNITISGSAGTITVTTKKGWDYLWVEYVNVVDTASTPKRLVKRPIAAHVEKVYDDGDFATLGIGT